MKLQLDWHFDSFARRVARFECTLSAQGDRKPVVMLNNSSPRDGNGLVKVQWRLISAIRAWPSMGLSSPQLVDYSTSDGIVLRNAVDIINKRKPDLTWDHSSSSQDIMGHIEGAFWQAKRPGPQGIDAWLVVDPGYDEKAAHGLSNGVLRSGSIGMTVDVEPSHRDMPIAEFVEKQGETVDGKTVRWLLTKVIDVRHMAIVPAGSGADPHAGRINEQENRSVDKKMTLKDRVISKSANRLFGEETAEQKRGIEKTCEKMFSREPEPVMNPFNEKRKQPASIMELLG